MLLNYYLKLVNIVYFCCAIVHFAIFTDFSALRNTYHQHHLTVSNVCLPHTRIAFNKMCLAVAACFMPKPNK